MLGIYADVIRTATRTGAIEMREVPNPKQGARRRWLGRLRKVSIDPAKL